MNTWTEIDHPDKAKIIDTKWVFKTNENGLKKVWLVVRGFQLKEDLDWHELCNIDPSCMLSQCYDGASVMSGKVSGVATRIENKLGRKIPYVHCYNHRLHLIVVRTISEMTFISLFYDQCIMLHEFFHHGKIAALYGGKRIGRLLKQRRSGHLAVTKIV